jgi:protein-tyrosine phosphatase
MINILFICMGNICRSPSAEGFFTAALQDSGIRQQVSTDSAGTHSWHIGHAPDPRAIDSAADFNVEIGHLRARKVTASDFEHFDLIIAMDRSNLADLQRIQPAGSKASLKMMMDYHPEGRPQEVPDPYYGGMEGFTYMCELLKAASAGLLEDIESHLSK